MRSAVRHIWRGCAARCGVGVWLSIDEAWSWGGSARRGCRSEACLGSRRHDAATLAAPLIAPTSTRSRPRMRPRRRRWGGSCRSSRPPRWRRHSTARRPRPGWPSSVGSSTRAASYYPAVSPPSTLTPACSRRCHSCSCFLILCRLPPLRIR